MKRYALRMASLGFLVACITLAALFYIDETNENNAILGRVEKVYVEGADITLTGRVDTGAGVASVNAEILEIKKPSKPGGPEKVVFRIENENKTTRTLERKIIAWQNIKKKGGAGYIKRPVVEMDFCIGGKQVEARVNLAERDEFLYPLLVGRNILKAGDFLIDPARKFKGSPVCKTAGT